MQQPSEAGTLIRFGVFEVDLQAGELRRHGRTVKLQEQPFQILTLLLAHRGEILKREEIKEKLWPPGTFVDFEHSIATAVKKLRIALGDDAESPRYVETVPRHGYRFIVPLEHNGHASSEPQFPDAVIPAPTRPLQVEVTHSLSPPQAAVSSHPLRRKLGGIAIAAGLAAFTGLSVWFFTRSDPSPNVRHTAQLTEMGRVAGSIRPVTDGSRIYFVQRFGGRNNLAQISVEGGEPVLIPTPFASTSLYDISTDHSQLLVGSVLAGEDAAALWVLPTSGGSPHRLGDVTATGAAWSPDRRRIAYTRGAHLFVVNSDGSGSHEVASLPGPAWGPRWSPDASVLRLTVEDPTITTLSLWEIYAQGKNLHPLFPLWRQTPAKYGNGESGGDWTPDGKYFVFQSAHGDVSNIWAVRESGFFRPWLAQTPLLLTTSNFHLWNVTFGANGRSLLFAGAKDSRELARYDPPKATASANMA